MFWIIIFGFSHVKASNLHWEHLPTLKTLGDTAIVLFFAFGGFETSLNVSGEIKNPKRTIPRGLLLAGLIVLVLYLLLQIVTQGVLGSHINEFKDTPLAAVAEKIVGTAGVTILLIAAIISCMGNVSGDVLASPRLLFAGAKDGLFPKFLGKVHPRFATPYMAIIIYSALIFLFAVSGGFKQLAILASGALLVIYLLVILAMISLRLKMKKEVDMERSFKVPGGLVIPVIAIGSIIWVLSHLSLQEILSLIVFMAAVCVIYVVMKKFQKK